MKANNYCSEDRTDATIVGKEVKSFGRDFHSTKNIGLGN